MRVPGPFGFEIGLANRSFSCLQSHVLKLKNRTVANPSTDIDPRIHLVLMTNPKTPFHQQRLIPGRLFAIPFVIVLVFLLWLVFSMANRFQGIMKQLDATRAAWPNASAAFLERVESMDKTVKEQLGNDLVSKLSALQAETKSSTQFDQQSRAVADMYKLVGSRAELKNSLNHPEVLFEEVIASEKLRESLQSDFVGRCTVSGLQLKLPPVFVPSQ